MSYMYVLCRLRHTHTHMHTCTHMHTHQIDAHQDDANAVSFADESSHIISSGGDDGICKVSYFGL